MNEVVPGKRAGNAEQQWETGDERWLSSCPMGNDVMGARHLSGGSKTQRPR